MQFYLLISDQSQGPFTPEQITEKIKVGECTADTLAWKEGMDEWQALKHVCPSPKVPPALPETHATRPAEFATGNKMLLDFIHAFKGLLKCIQASPLSSIWKGVMEDLQRACVLPKEPPAFPDTRSALPAGQQRLASGSKVFLDFFRGYKGLLQRIQSSPLPQPAHWYDRYPIIFPAAFLAFFFFGLGLIPLVLTSRLSGGDKGRLAVFSAWPIWMALLPVFGFILFFLLPIVAFVMMWVKRWFSPNVRYAVTGICGLFLALSVISTAVGSQKARKQLEERRQQAQKEFNEQRANVFAAIKSTTENAQTLNLPAYEDGDALVERYKFIQDEELSKALSQLRMAIFESGQRYFRAHSKQKVVLSEDERSQGLRVTQSGYFAAISKEVLDQAISYQIVGDTDALNALIEAGLLIRLKGGVRVQVMKRPLFSGLVEIRAIGTTQNLWTNMEAINP